MFSLTSGSASLAINEDSEFDDLSVRAEQIGEVVFLGAPWDVSDEDGGAIGSAAAAASSATAVAASAATASASSASAENRSVKKSPIFDN